MLATSRRIVRVSKRRKVSQLGVEFIKLNKLSFWDFLQAPFLKQLENLAYLFLKQRKIIRLEQECFYEEARIDFTNLEHALQEHIWDVTERIGKRPTMILVGRDIYHELITNPGFHIERMYDLKIFGMTVYLVPWMEGMVAWGDYER